MKKILIILVTVLLSSCSLFGTKNDNDMNQKDEGIKPVNNENIEKYDNEPLPELPVDEGPDI